MADKGSYDNDAVQEGTRQDALATADNRATPVPFAASDEEQQRKENARQEENRDNQVRKQQDALAVDENDPRVQPHLARMETHASVDAEEVRRREAAREQGRARLDDARAQVEAASAQFKEAQDRLQAARDNFTHQTEAMAQLAEPLATTSPAHFLRPGEDTVPMFFPRQVVLNTGEHRQTTFEAGVHQVPESLQTHWWLVSNGVRPYKGKIPEGRPADEPNQPADAPAPNDELPGSRIARARARPSVDADALGGGSDLDDEYGLASGPTRDVNINAPRTVNVGPARTQG